MDREALLVETKQKWTQAKEKERETDTHPCDNWNPDECMCKGSCACHWAKVEPEYATTINRLRALNERFYWMCFHAGIGGRAHPFLEFNGLMSAYIQVLEKAVRAGLNPQELSAHTGKPIPVEGYEIAYLGEKLDCIFGPVLGSNPKARAILLKKLFQITE